jgi:hypothetical protein
VGSFSNDYRTSIASSRLLLLAAGRTSQHHMDCKGDFQMIRTTIVTLGLLLLVGCTQQMNYSLIVHFQNACDSPVEVTARHYTNVDERWETAVLDTKVGLNEKTSILHIWAFGTNPVYMVPPIYKLELSANGRRRSYDKVSFLAILKKSEHVGRGVHVWTVNDPSLCP